MRIDCPLCGARDRREFWYQGDATLLTRPEGGAEVHSDWLHLRDNPAGPTRELWFHEAGCSAWLVVARDTVSHEVLSVELVDAD